MLMRPSQEEHRTFNLSEVIGEFENDGYARSVIEARFKKLLKLIKSDVEYFKDEKGQIWFYEEERPILKAFLIEVGDTYLTKMINKTRYGKIADEYEATNSFRKNMLLALEALPDDDIKTEWIKVIESVSKYALRTALAALLSNVAIIKKKINSFTISDEDMIMLVLDGNHALESWMKVHKL